MRQPLRNNQVRLSDDQDGENPPNQSDSVPEVTLQVGDLLRSGSVALDLPDPRLCEQDTLIKGRFLHQELRSGLSVHGGDVREEHAFTVKSEQEEGLSCIFFLSGEVETRFGDKNLKFSAQPQQPMQAAAVVKTREDRFERSTRSAQHVQHVVVSATAEWLDLEGLAGVGANASDLRCLREHLRVLRWTPSARLTQLVRELFTPSPFLPQLRKLYLEGRAVEIVAHTVTALLQADNLSDARRFSRHELLRLERARELIAHNLDQALSIDGIAREVGVSASGLQRLFRRAEGMSVFDYVRGLRLDAAHKALRDHRSSVQEASLLAGYRSAANFATAFKRRFGCAPSAVNGTRLAGR